MEFTPMQILIPAVVAAIVTAIRQVSAGLDGPKAYWASIILNIIGQVIVQLQAPEGSVIVGTMLGLGTGAIVSPGLASTLKRVGLAKLIKPRQD